MKFGRITYGLNPKQTSRFQYANVGDWFQTFAIDEIYKKMGIPLKDIINIQRSALTSYDGEDVILPMQGWFGCIRGINCFPMSHKIHPVFFGYHSVDRANYNYAAIESYTKNQPIGCRDEPTWKKMKEHEIEAFISGCMTILLPSRENDANHKKIFFVDTPNNTIDYFPSDLKKNVEFISHEIKIDFYACSEEETTLRFEAICKDLLEKYKNEAALVVTSRLHCAGPCLGMGIPVIMVRKYYDDRYAWLDKYLPLYTPENFHKINWNAKAPDLTAIKNLLFNVVSKRLNGIIDTQLDNKVHDFYFSRERAKIKNPLLTQLYHFVNKYSPTMASFIRDGLLQKWTVATARSAQARQ